MLLDNLPRRTPARIVAIDWSRLSDDEGLRLRALGFDEGVEIETRHRGIFLGSDPLAVAIGRMMIALRRSHAKAITVEPVAGAAK